MEQEKQSHEIVKKLEIDKPLDFRYHAAYLAYSKTWDENPSEENRTKLNEILIALSGEEESYSNFYNALSPFRKELNPEIRNSAQFRSQSKREWNKNEARTARLSRFNR